MFLEDAVEDFVKYNEENCEIKDGNIIAKEGKEDVKILSLDNNKYFEIDEIKEYLEKNDPELKKFIKTRNLISLGNNEIITVTIDIIVVINVPTLFHLYFVLSGFPSVSSSSKLCKYLSTFFVTKLLPPNFLYFL